MLDKSSDFKFIIADDDIDIIRNHREIVKSLYPENKIYEFMNGFEAISFLEAKSLGDTWHPEEWGVISDFYMPIKNGGQLLKFCESKGITKKILVSSANSESLRSKMQVELEYDFKDKILLKGMQKIELTEWLQSLN